MFFNAHVSVIIGDKELKTVSSIHASNSSENLGAKCDVMVPLNCRIEYVNGNHEFLTDQTKNLFVVGDAITITAWYDGYDPVTVFKGFIYDFEYGTPTKIMCTDYIYFFNLGRFGAQRLLVKKNKKSKVSVPSIGASFKSIKFKDLLQKLIDFTNDTIDDQTTDTDHVQLITPVPDFTMVNLTFAQMSPAAILEWIKKELGINISLSGNHLYANVASNTLKVVKYDTTINVLKSTLQRPNSVFTRYKLKAWFIREDGTKDSVEVGDENGTLKEVWFFKVERNSTLYNKMANDALQKYKQVKYNGSVTTLLYPDVDLFDKADYHDYRYPAKNANYVVTGVDIHIDAAGYRRDLRFAYLSDN
jgi:hypothetical protein